MAKKQGKTSFTRRNCSRHNLRRSILVYISFGFDYKSISYCYNVFPFQFFDPSHSGASFSLILSSSFHLHPPHVDQVAGFDPCPISITTTKVGYDEKNISS